MFWPLYFSLLIKVKRVPILIIFAFSFYLLRFFGVVPFMQLLFQFSIATFSFTTIFSSITIFSFFLLPLPLFSVFIPLTYLIPIFAFSFFIILIFISFFSIIIVFLFDLVIIFIFSFCLLIP